MKILLLKVLLAAMIFNIPAWANEAGNDDVQWEKHYEKMHKSDDCESTKHMLENFRTMDARVTSFMAPLFLSLYYKEGICFDRDIAESEKLLVWAAERGDAMATSYLAHLHYLRNTCALDSHFANH